MSTIDPAELRQIIAESQRKHRQTLAKRIASASRLSLWTEARVVVVALVILGAAVALGAWLGSAS
jgi:hypothetical protein